MKTIIIAAAVCVMVTGIATCGITFTKTLPTTARYVGYTPLYIESVGASVTGLTMYVISPSSASTNYLYVRYKTEDLVIGLSDTNLVSSSVLVGTVASQAAGTNIVAGITYDKIPKKDIMVYGVYFKVLSYLDGDSVAAPTNVAATLKITTLP